MNPLFYVAMGLSLSSIAVTVYAVLTAPEGHEDEEGFHPIRRRASRTLRRRAAEQEHESGAHPDFFLR